MKVTASPRLHARDVALLFFSLLNAKALSKLALLAIVVFIVPSTFSRSMATDWHVNASVRASGNGRSWQTAFKRIQEGIDTASDGDTVTVAEGTYLENVQSNGKNIVLRSTDRFDPTVVAKTIIDGNKAGSVVTFAGTEAETCVLSGFTIRNGNADYGGGVFGDTSKGPRTRATIKNNTIVANSAKYGGGLYGCDGLVVSNLITGNSGDWGGGLAACDGLIVNNTISANSADSEGGGLSGRGGVIRNNVISKNSAASWGGGLRSCNGSIVNNTIVGNMVRTEGSALSDCSGKKVNCIVWGNVGGNQLHFSTIATYSCIEGWQGEGEGNIRWFPYFANAANGDYHLRSWSLCIDAGDPSSDFLNEPQPNGGRVDMGAYGNTPEATPACEDTDNDLLPDDWEIANGLCVIKGDAALDEDADNLTNLREFLNFTNPSNSDTDDDGLSDGGEVDIHHTNPLKADTDSDGMSDNQEVLAGTNPLDAHRFFGLPKSFLRGWGLPFSGQPSPPGRTDAISASTSRPGAPSAGTSPLAPPTPLFPPSTGGSAALWRCYYRVEVLP